jgi:hypothetical protein
MLMSRDYSQGCAAWHQSAFDHVAGIMIHGQSTSKHKRPTSTALIVDFVPTKRSMTVLPIDKQFLVRLHMTEVVRIIESFLQAFDARHSQLDNAIIIQRALPTECCSHQLLTCGRRMVLYAAMSGGGSSGVLMRRTYLDVADNAVTGEPGIDDWHVYLRPVPVKVVFAQRWVTLEVHGELVVAF